MLFKWFLIAWTNLKSHKTIENQRSPYKTLENHIKPYVKPPQPSPPPKQKRHRCAWRLCALDIRKALKIPFDEFVETETRLAADRCFLFFSKIAFVFGWFDVISSYYKTKTNLLVSQKQTMWSVLWTFICSFLSQNVFWGSSSLFTRS